MTIQREKSIRCSLRKTRPIGPMFSCENLYCFSDCIKISKIEISQGLNEKKGQYRTVIINYDGRSKCCLLCGKSIAKPETPFWSFKGMLAIHLKAKHQEIFREYKRDEISLDKLYYLKSI